MTPQQPSNFHCHLVNAQGLGRVGPDTHHITEGATEWSFVFGSHPRLSEQIRRATSFPTSTSLSLWLMCLFLTEGHGKMPG